MSVPELVLHLKHAREVLSRTKGKLRAEQRRSEKEKAQCEKEALRADKLERLLEKIPGALDVRNNKDTLHINL